MFKRMFMILFCLMITLSSVSVAATPRDVVRANVSSDDVFALHKSLSRMGFDIAGINRDQNYVEVIATEDDLTRLNKLNYSYQIIERYKEKRMKGVPAGYHSYDEFITMMSTVETNYPNIAKVIDVGAEYGLGNTYENRQLLAMKISDNVLFEEDEPSIYIVGNHHAREITTAEYAMWAIDQLTANYAIDTQIQEWVNNNQIYIGVVWNPDGHRYCFDVDEWWRKNRKPAGSYYGIDLNRNFDFRWDGPAGGSTYQYSDTYRGPYPNSEEETQIEIAFAQDRHFAKVLDMHSYGGEVLYTYYNSYNFPTILENWFEDKAEEFAYAFNYNGYYRKASAEGEHYQWEICNIGSFAFLVETGSSFQPSFATAQSEFSGHLWPGMQWIIDHEIPLKGHVTNSITGSPVVADISITGISYTQGEIRRSEPKYGRYHYFLPPGSYDITFSAAGYYPSNHNVTITQDVSTTLDVQLDPESVPALGLYAGLFIILLISLTFRRKIAESF